MSVPEASAENLTEWLDYIASVHLQEIELGLDRVRAVAVRLDCLQPADTVITVAGTNGKGSVVACVEAVLSAAGCRTGSYTSPHIHRFNERIQINRQPVSDAQIVSALAAIELAREDISLSYFEFATLAALLLFRQQQVEVAILEVGLGGRLDAVNLIDPTISVITSIDLDHQEWLGDDRESIAVEKAGILRPAVPFICGDLHPPKSLQQRAQQLGCPSYFVEQEFSFQASETGWHWRGKDHSGQPMTLAGSGQAQLAPTNVACALQVLALLPIAIDTDLLTGMIGSLTLAGRQEWCVDRDSGHRVLLDVGHNPAAMACLADRLQAWRSIQPEACQIIVVMAVMADKDIQDMARNLESSTDIWYIAELAVPRALGLADFELALQNSGFTRPVQSFRSIGQAYREACDRAGNKDLVVVSGSFYTVAEIRPLTAPEATA